MTNKTPQTEPITTTAAPIDAPGASPIEDSEFRIQNCNSSIPPALTPGNYPHLYDPDQPLDADHFPQFFRPDDGMPIAAHQVPHFQDRVPNSSGVSPAEYRRRQIQRLHARQMIATITSSNAPSELAAEQPYYYCAVYTNGLVYSHLARRYLLPWESIPRHEPPNPRDMSYRRSVQEIYDRNNEESASFSKKEKWVREYFRDLHQYHRVQNTTERFVYDPAQLNLAPRQQPDPAEPTPEEIEHHIAQAINTTASKQCIMSTPSIKSIKSIPSTLTTDDDATNDDTEDPTDPATALPQKIENAAAGTPADTENRIHETANHAIIECRALLQEIAASPTTDPAEVAARDIRLRQLLTVTKVLLHLRELHRPLRARRRPGRPRKAVNLDFRR